MNNKETGIFYPGSQARVEQEQRPYNVLVLDACERQALVAVRSLGRHGLRVAALESAERLPAPAFASRWCQHEEVCTGPEGTESYLSEVGQALDRTGAKVLLPSSDGTIALLRRYRSQLEKRVVLTLAHESALAIAVDKEQTLEVARSLGIAVPAAVHIHSVSELGEALREIGLPAVVKPAESWADNGLKRNRLVAQLVTTPDEAKKVVEALTLLGGTVLFQQYLTGERESVHFMYSRGQMYARFAQWAKRTYPLLGGSSVLRRSIAIPPDIGVQAERLVRAINLEGYAEVEFRRSSQGTPYLMEINPRLSASIELAVSAGVDFPHLLYQWASGEHIDMVQEYVVGKWMRYLGGDILAALTAIRDRGRPGVASPGRTIFDFCSSFLVPMRYDYLDWGDLAPAGTATRSFLHRLLSLAKVNFPNAQQAKHCIPSHIPIDAALHTTGD